MATVILNHRVRDFDKWKPFYDRDADRRKAAGLNEIAIGRNSKDPNDVFMVFKTEKPEKVEQMMNDPELKKTMDEAGVLNQPNMTILD